MMGIGESDVSHPGNSLISRCLMLATLVTACGLFTAGAYAATIHVPGDQPTIQAGIDAAVSGLDEVVVAPGTYAEIIDFDLRWEYRPLRSGDVQHRVLVIAC